MFEMMAHFGLKKIPFGPCRGEHFRTKDVSKVQDGIAWAVSENALLAIVGDVGCGKTTALEIALGACCSGERFTLVECLSLDRERLRINNIMTALFYNLTQESLKRDMEARTHQLRRILGTLSREKGIILIIDESHLLHHSTLSAIKRLREIRYGGRAPLFATLLVGQPLLIHNIKRFSEVGLRTQIVEITGMTEREATGYIRFKCEHAGRGDLFDEEAADLIGKRENRPLWINSLCMQAMEAAFNQGCNKISAETLRSIAGGRTLQSLVMEAGLSHRDIARGTGLPEKLVRKTIENNALNTEIGGEIDSFLTTQKGAIVKPRLIAQGGNGK